MIKIFKYLYIHPLTIFLFLICYITRQLETLLMCYFIMTVHELSHLVAALWIGLTPSKIVIYPFGLNLKLKNKMVYSLSDEIILYLSGPLSNIIMALVSLFFSDSTPFKNEFYIQNIALFLLNMLPCVPLDGGVILRKVIAYFKGYKKADTIMKIISGVLIFLFIILGVYLAYQYSFNYTICFIIIFLLCNIFMSKEKYNIDLVRELMFYEDKQISMKKQKIRFILWGKEDESLIIKEFATGYYNIVFFINNNGVIKKIKTETEILKNICKKSNSEL